MSVEIDGLKELESQLKRMVSRLESSEGDIVMAGAKVQYPAIKNSLPVNTGKEKQTIRISKPIRENNQTFVEIGWTESSKVAFRSHFVEWGTVKQKPRLTITKAIKSSDSAKQKAMIDAIKRRI